MLQANLIFDDPDSPVARSRYLSADDDLAARVAALEARAAQVQGEEEQRFLGQSIAQLKKMLDLCRPDLGDSQPVKALKDSLRQLLDPLYDSHAERQARNARGRQSTSMTPPPLRMQRLNSVSPARESARDGSIKPPYGANSTLPTAPASRRGSMQANSPSLTGSRGPTPPFSSNSHRYPSTLNPSFS